MTPFFFERHVTRLVRMYQIRVFFPCNKKEKLCIWGFHGPLFNCAIV
jgi:hypothetical protein